MAFLLEDIRNNHKAVRIIIGGKPLNLKIDPNYLTQTVMDEYREAADEHDYDTMGHIFGNIVVWWDFLVEEDGDEMPKNGETLRNMPLSVLNRIWDEIAGAVSPKSRKKSGN